LAALAEEVPVYAGTIQHKVDTLQQLMRSHIMNLALNVGHKPEPKPMRPRSQSPANHWP
jgi:hypothetical protein